MRGLIGGGGIMLHSADRHRHHEGWEAEQNIEKRSGRGWIDSQRTGKGYGERRGGVVGVVTCRGRGGGGGGGAEKRCLLALPSAA